MKVKAVWTEKMKFTGVGGEHQVAMDANPPIGTGAGFSPKQLMVIGLCGCTAMDVIALMRKYKQTVETFEVAADATPSQDGVHPVVYSEFGITYSFTGNLEPEKLLEAVKLSQTKYCGVSAMLSKAAPILYNVQLNGQAIGTGQANFG